MLLGLLELAIVIYQNAVIERQRQHDDLFGNIKTNSKRK
jgi:hypothetical protein